MAQPAGSTLFVPRIGCAILLLLAAGCTVPVTSIEAEVAVSCDMEPDVWADYGLEELYRGNTELYEPVCDGEKVMFVTCESSYGPSDVPSHVVQVVYRVTGYAFVDQGSFEQDVTEFCVQLERTNRVEQALRDASAGPEHLYAVDEHGAITVLHDDVDQDGSHLVISYRAGICDVVETHTVVWTDDLSYRVSNEPVCPCSIAVDRDPASAPRNVLLVLALVALWLKRRKSTRRASLR